MCLFNNYNKVYISLGEFAEYAGLSMSTAYKYSSSGKIPTYKPFGKAVYVKVEEIAQQFEDSRICSNEELERNLDLNSSNSNISGNDW